MNYIFLMDPLTRVIVEKDTTLALMVGAHRKKHKVYFLPDGGMVRKDGVMHFHVREVTPQYDKARPFIDRGSAVLPQGEVHVVFIRNDPPFGEQYLHNTWLLDLLPRHIPVINAPAGIRTVNEKIWASQFNDLVPATLIGCDRAALTGFVAQHAEVIAKPTDSYGGQSVFHVHPGQKNTKVILETLTRNWRKDIIVQKYIPEALDGDKRILLLDGEPLGAVLRKHAEDDHRNNFFAGGKPQATDITGRDREIIKRLKPELRKLGLYFVGIDIIGEYLIEVNVTSPTCLREMNDLYGRRLEDKVIGFSEKLIDQFAAKNKISP
ncbi:MAG: glutathione synthase [Omnitrophica WOR_2 bacterium RIFCSPHIGHO2_02_FULL_52_10]|nr:MAG: glutathione synthase [Omnitrophica WOR_2 bacterium RIFCSPHIGHO2_02_FULL_52_10]